MQPHAPLIVHAATSTTHPHANHEFINDVLHPFWRAHPPQFRLSSKPYKTTMDRNAILPEDSITFRVPLSLLPCCTRCLRYAVATDSHS